MVIYEEIKQNLEKMKPEISNLKEAIGYESAIKKNEELELIASQPKFWDDRENSKKVLDSINSNKHKINAYAKLKELYDTIEITLEIASEDNDDSYYDELNAMYHKFERSLEEQTLMTLLTGEYDHLNSILTLHAGAGGTEAQDWVSMLLRMYTRWAEKKGYEVTVLDLIEGDEAGIKSVSALIKGLNAYGFLKSEVGVHRLVRISPFDSSGRRHTSFASVEVMPEITEAEEIDIKPEDIKIDRFRAGGAGGQHVNMTDSAVRVTHLPSGVVASCQNERSQHQNLENAMKMLMSRLAEIKEREHLDKIDDIKGVQNKIEWGSQIRSYVFMPYTMVKDHRTNFESGNLEKVMDGDLDGFINSYLKSKI